MKSIKKFPERMVNLLLCTTVTELLFIYLILRFCFIQIFPVPCFNHDFISSAFTLLFLRMNFFLNFFPVFPFLFGRLLSVSDHDCLAKGEMPFLVGHRSRIRRLQRRLPFDRKARGWSSGIFKRKKQLLHVFLSSWWSGLDNRTSSPGIFSHK